MNLGEKSAVEAMLGLSRPNLNYPAHPSYPTLSRHTQSPPMPSSTAPTLRSLPSPPSATPQPLLLDIPCGSSVSPSLSPVQYKRQPATSHAARPKAMRLSQLLTDDSPPDTSSRRSSEHQPHQHTQLPYSLQLPRTSAPPRHGVPVTEPVTPPFSPPVLPPLSAVATLPLAPHVLNNENAAPSTTWAPLPTIKPPHTVLANRDNNMPAREPVLNQVVQPAKTRASEIRKIVKRPYKKYYSNPTPSSHCHVCARTSKAVKFAICARIAEGLCRKVTCYKCFAKFGWDWEAAVNSKTWICVHCRGVCPEGRSQCYIYSRVNSKRESKRGKKAKAQQSGGAGGVTAGLPGIGGMGGQGATLSEGKGMHHFIRPV